MLPLKMLFDTSYKLNQPPTDWKTGHITAIFKKGNKCDPSNYRPISLTSFICKIMESIIRDDVIKFLFNNNNFSNNQYGFTKGRPAALHVLSLYGPLKWTQDNK